MGTVGCHKARDQCGRYQCGGGYGTPDPGAHGASQPRAVATLRLRPYSAQWSSAQTATWRTSQPGLMTAGSTRFCRGRAHPNSSTETKSSTESRYAAMAPGERNAGTRRLAKPCGAAAQHPANAQTRLELLLGVTVEHWKSLQSLPADKTCRFAKRKRIDASVLGSKPAAQ